MGVDIQPDVLRALDEALGLGGRSRAFDANTLLFGSMPELDSMAVVDLITALEDRFGIVFEDDEITGQAFSTVGALTAFVQAKLSA